MVGRNNEVHPTIREIADCIIRDRSRFQPCRFWGTVTIGYIMECLGYTIRGNYVFSRKGEIIYLHPNERKTLEDAIKKNELGRQEDTRSLLDEDDRSFY